MKSYAQQTILLFFTNAFLFSASANSQGTALATEEILEANPLVSQSLLRIEFTRGGRNCFLDYRDAYGNGQEIAPERDRSVILQRIEIVQGTLNITAVRNTSGCDGEIRINNELDQNFSIRIAPDREPRVHYVVIPPRRSSPLIPEVKPFVSGNDIAIQYTSGGRNCVFTAADTQHRQDIYSESDTDLLTQKIDIARGFIKVRALPATTGCTGEIYINGRFDRDFFVRQREGNAAQISYIVYTPQGS